MSKNILFTLILLVSFWTIEPAEAAKRNVSPECSYAQDPTCYTMLDEDGDGGLDTTAATAAFTSVTGGYSANVKDCQKVGGYANQTDATSIVGTAVSKPTPTPYFTGEIACGFNVANATYYSWLRVRNSVGAVSVWVKSGSTHGRNFDNTDQTVLQLTNPFGWRQLDTVGTPRTFALNGVGALYLKSEALAVFDCWFISDSSTAAPICQGETGAVQPDYTILELGAAAAPTSWDHATFANANVMALNGTTTGTPCGSSITAKLIWDDAGTDRIYGSIACGSDADLVASSASNDTEALITATADKIDFRWRSIADLFQAFDTDMQMITATPDNKVADGDWSGTNNARDLTVSLNTTITGSIAASTAWRIFFVADAGTITADSIGLCQLAIIDRDTAATSSIYFRGSSNTDAAQFGKCKWSSTTLGGADTTPPTVTSFTVPAGNIQSTSAQGLANTNEAGNCKIHAGTVSGVYTIISSGSNSANGICQETITGLTAGTSYLAVMKVTDAAGNTGTSSEVAFSTPTTSTATHFVGPTDTGTQNCSSAANRCQMSDVWTGGWRPVAPGDIIEMVDGTYSCFNCMIQPPAGLSGLQTAPITIRAQNDGLAIINGGGTQHPIKLQDNDWFIIEGVNAHSGFCDVVKIGNGADNNIVRRVMAWDASATTNCMVFSIHNNTGNVLEDIAGFGTGRKILQWFSSTTNATLKVRRAWARWEKSTQIGPKMPFSLAYNSRGAIFENVIGTWDETAMAGATVDQPYGILSMDRIDSNYCANSKYLGSIAYLRSADLRPLAGQGNVYGNRSVDCLEFRDVVTYIEPGTHTNIPSFKGQQFDGNTVPPTPAPVGDRKLTNFTEIGGTAASILGGGTSGGNGWTLSNRQVYATIAAMNTASANPFQNSSGTGARVCKRYVDGVQTNTSLWPWPMNDRIIQALSQAGKPTVDVTATMEGIFGPIPAACR